jgi:carbamoyl-phosphate synthase large subunit
VTPSILVLGAGTGASNNLLRSLRAGLPEARLLGAHADRFTLRKSAADRSYLLPRPGQPGFLAALGRVAARERVSLLVPGSDDDARALARLRARLPCRVFLPASRVIALCQDKYRLAVHLRHHGVPAPLTLAVSTRATPGRLFRQLGRPARAWCRVRAGTGSLGAIPIASGAQARAWIAYWERMRGVPASSFTLAEYLPGRDFACQSLWKDGALVLVKTAERLAYFGGGSQPSGVSSTPALAKTVIEPRVVDAAVRAVRSLDRNASGVFAVDLKEDVRGVPCVTEINAGRFFMITPLFDLTGKHNMAATYVRLAVGEPVTIREACDDAPDYYLIRDLDTLPAVHHADELFDGIEEPAGRGAADEGR